jgi:hypothetical protein
MQQYDRAISQYPYAGILHSKMSKNWSESIIPAANSQAGTTRDGKNRIKLLFESKMILPSCSLQCAHVNCTPKAGPWHWCYNYCQARTNSVKDGDPKVTLQHVIPTLLEEEPSWTMAPLAAQEVWTAVERLQEIKSGSEIWNDSHLQG